MHTEGDVIVTSPLGGAEYSFQQRIQKGLIWFPIKKVIRPFHFGWDFPTAGQKCEVFGENDPQGVQISKNTCLEGTSLRQAASFELSCVQIGSRVWAVRVARKEKTKK